MAPRIPRSTGQCHDHGSRDERQAGSRSAERPASAGHSGRNGDERARGHRRLCSRSLHSNSAGTLPRRKDPGVGFPSQLRGFSRPVWGPYPGRQPRTALRACLSRFAWRRAVGRPVRQEEPHWVPRNEPCCFPEGYPTPMTLGQLMSCIPGSSHHLLCGGGSRLGVAPAASAFVVNLSTTWEEQAACHIGVGPTGCRSFNWKINEIARDRSGWTAGCGRHLAQRISRTECRLFAKPLSNIGFHRSRRVRHLSMKGLQSLPILHATTHTGAASDLRIIPEQPARRRHRQAAPRREPGPPR